MTPSHFVIFLKEDFLQIPSGLEFILGYFGFTKFGVLALSRIDFTKFGVLEFFWNRQNPLFLCIGLDQICRACYFCFKTWIEVDVPVSVFILFSRGYHAFYFLVNPVLFILFFCLVYSDSSALDSCWEGLGVGWFFSLDLSNVYWFGPGCSNVDG